jgi:exodeoxyribonuclease III
MEQSTVQTVVLSWNVAGWKTACDGIVQNHGTVGAWLERHRADVLCLQETKVQNKWVSDNYLQIAPSAIEWDSFWCPCRLAASTKRSGMNGVATFARKGATLSADCRPLQDESLDREGRCVKTDHGDFVLFNCYVPNSGSGCKQLPLKLKFLRALRHAMDRAKARGKHVVVCGDLNLRAREQDCYWAWRAVSIEAMLSTAPTGGERDAGEVATQKLRAQLRKCWPTIVASLAGRTVRPVTVKSASSGTQTKFRIFAPKASVTASGAGGATPAARGREATLGKPFESEARAARSFDLVRRTVVDEERGVELVVQPPMRLGVGELAECMDKLGGVRWSEVQQRALARSRFACSGDARPLAGASCAPRAQARAAGSHVAPSAQWLRATMHDLDLVDVFAELWPDAEARYTCWEQRTNGRYANRGSRIDYFLVPRALFARYVRRGAALYGGAEGGAEGGATAAAEGGAEGGATAAAEGRARAANSGGVLSEAAALRACTAHGRWRGASYDGGGIADGSAKAYASQFRAPSSGMVYTPPKLSDHIGVSLLLEGRPPLGLALDGADAKTRACQPQRQQRRISDMFSKRSTIPAAPRPNAPAHGGGGGGSGAAQLPPRKRPKAVPRKGSIEAMFARR